MKKKNILFIGAAAVACSLRTAVRDEGMKSERVRIIDYIEEVVKCAEGVTVLELRLVVRGLEQQLGVCPSKPFNHFFQKKFSPPKVLGRKDLVREKQNRVKRKR